MRILILHPGALGDTILALPSLGILKQQFPEAEVTLAGNMDFLGTIAGGYAHAFSSLAALPLYRIYSDHCLSPSEQQAWQSYDRIIAWTGSGAPEFRRKLSQIHSCVRVACWRPQADERRHVSRLFVESLYPWIPMQKTILPARILPLPRAQMLAGELLRAREWGSTATIVALHAGAGSVQKRWDVGNLNALASYLLQRPEMRLLIIEGPAEPGAGSQVAAGLDRERIHVAESLPLQLVAALLAACRLFIGVDSGIAHLSAGLGVPSVVLFGPTDPRHWAPLGQHVTVIRGHNTRVNDITPMELVEVVDRVESLRN